MAELSPMMRQYMEIKAKSLGLKSINYYGKQMEKTLSVEKITMTVREYDDFIKQMHRLI